MPDQGTTYTCPKCGQQWRYGHLPELDLPPRDELVEAHNDRGRRCPGSRCYPIEKMNIQPTGEKQ